MNRRWLAIAVLASGEASTRAVASEVPPTLSLAARVSKDGAPLAGPHRLSLTLFDAPAGGGALWSESRENVDIDDGLVFVELGTGTAFPPGLFNGSVRFLEIEIDDVRLQPRLGLTSVPYALRAGSAGDAESLGGLHPNELIRTVAPGEGLTGGGSGGTVSLGVKFAGNGTAASVARSDHDHAGQYLPRGQSLRCAPRTRMAGLDATTGDALCEETSTPGTLGEGLVSSGDTLSIDFPTPDDQAGVGTQAARADHRHDVLYCSRDELAAPGTVNASGNPVDWTRLKNVPAGLADGIDDTAGVRAGPGIAVAADVVSVDFVPAGSDGAGGSTLVPRADHNHDTRYATRTGLSSVGYVNMPTNPVDWSQLKNVPAGFADAVDNGRDYSAGAGLSLNADAFSVAFTGSGGDAGSAATAARGDHAHDSQYAPRSVLAAAGTVNSPTNPVDWTQLKGVPASLAAGNGGGPIAMAHVSAAGVAVGTPNVSVTYNTTAMTYSVRIAGESWTANTHMTFLTPASASRGLARITGSGGAMVVSFKDASGAAIDNSFWFLVFKP